jgi:hypothetical protein
VGPPSPVAACQALTIALEEPRGDAPEQETTMLKATLKTLDGLDEALAAHYKEKDGIFILDVDEVDGFALEDVNGLRSALSRQTQRGDEAVASLKEFEGIDPKVARDAIKAVEKFKDLDPEKDAEKIANEKFEAAKAQLVEHHQAELASRDERIAKSEKEIDGLTRHASALAAIEKADGNPRGLMPEVLKRTRNKRADDGSRVLEVLDTHGQPLYAAGGQNATLDDLLGELKKDEDWAFAFKGTGHSGSGAPPQNGSGGTPRPTTKKASEMSTDEKATFISEHGSDAWNKKVSDDYSEKAPAA